MYVEFGESEKDEAERKLIEFIQRKGGSVTPRDLVRGIWSIKKTDEAEQALTGLVKVGFGEWVNKASQTNQKRKFKLFDETA